MSATDRTTSLIPLSTVSKAEPSIIGANRGLRSVLDAVRVVAATDAAVLITGETGTGKELIAKAIHEQSSRCNSPYVKLNCAAIPANLLESELFGHERGAFPGAVTQTTGRFQMADRGTIYLDEIGDLPLELQPKLPRVLQEHEFERLGNGRTIRVDVRIVAATNRNLEEMVRERRFRADLFYRLNVFSDLSSAPAPALRGPSRVGLVLRQNVRCSHEQGNQSGLQRCHGSDSRIRVAGQYPRIAEFHRTGGHSVAGPGTAASDCRVEADGGQSVSNRRSHTRPDGAKLYLGSPGSSRLGCRWMQGCRRTLGIAAYDSDVSHKQAGYPSPTTHGSGWS